MLLRDLNLKISYRSNIDNMVTAFYNPVLSVAVSYKRAVGYFTISSLINAARGLSNLIENGGRVEIIASPKLNEEDINTIELGYRMKEDVVLDALIREFNNINSENEKEKMNYIATLIADNRLDIKIAIMDDYGAYHEKFGLVEDVEGNKILFTGSMNETENGQYNNFESFVVFKSWNDDQKQYLIDYEKNFSDLWDNKTERLVVKPFPKALEDKILEYRKPTYVKEKNIIEEDYDFVNLDKDYPVIPNSFKPREYQKEAISCWEKNNYRGLLSMATGTGKTLTGLYGVAKLFEERKRLVEIIVCPYQHLVEQWVEDVRKFNMKPVVCYSKYDWKAAVYRKVKLFNNKTIDSFTIVTTNATFVTSEMQKFLNSIDGEILLLVDEAHNAGQNNMKACLTDNYKYRLGLSATPRRFRDDENTNFIFEYFGGEVFSFDLERAINEGFLTKYYYFPHIVRLSEVEQEQYNDLSLKIAQSIKEEDGKIIINDLAKNLLIKRARIIAGAENKLEKLRELMPQYKDKDFMLFYCGATKVVDETDGNEDRQIKRVCKIIFNEFRIKNRKFTSEESPDERLETIEMFNDKSIQAIVAIKCLDEGVNIPAIQHAFILASNTDPKEFIQRRGRVLRKYPGKEFAYIHDFVTIPNSDGISSNLVESELKRVYEFNLLAENKEQNNDIIDDLVNRFSIDIEKIKDANEQYKIGGIVDEE